jgi:hypothetical protein
MGGGASTSAVPADKKLTIDEAKGAAKAKGGVMGNMLGKKRNKAGTSVAAFNRKEVIISEYTHGQKGRALSEALLDCATNIKQNKKLANILRGSDAEAASFWAKQVFVLDTDVGHDPDDMIAIAMLVKATHDLGVPAEQLALVSSGGGITPRNAKNEEVEGKPEMTETVHWRARLIRQLLHAMRDDALLQGDGTAKCFAAYLNKIPVFAGKAGSQVVDETWHNSGQDCLYDKGEYALYGQPCVEGCRAWVVEKEHEQGKGESSFLPFDEFIPSFIEKHTTDESKFVNWIEIGAATNLVVGCSRFE